MKKTSPRPAEPPRLSDRRFFGLAAAFLIFFAFAQIRTMLQEDAIFDEVMHLAAGVHYWRTGDLFYNAEHPPLIKLLAALPLLPLDPALPKWQNDVWLYGREFVYFNRVPAEQLLLRGRLVAVGFSLLLALAVGWWTRLRGGNLAGIIALGALCLDPNLIAHGRYVLTDIPVTLFGFAAWACFLEHLSTGKGRWLAGSSLALGLAAASKHSGAWLLPVLAILYAVEAWKHGGRWRSWWAAARTLGALSAGVAICLAVVYAPEHVRWLSGAPLPPMAPPDASPPTHAWREGIEFLRRHNETGHTAFFAGRISDRGWWWYFPAVFFVKAPLALLLALPAAAVGWLGRPRGGASALALLLPVGLYLAAAMTSNLNIGLRYIFPVFPFLFTFLGLGLSPLSGARGRALPAALLAVLLLESLSVWPHFLAFTNRVAGGPENAISWVVDSNADWGQDLGNLARYLREQGNPRLCISYFGQAPFSHHRLDPAPVPSNADLAAGVKPACELAAVSGTVLQGVYIPGDPFEWLRRRDPVARVGYSIYVYDVRDLARK